jgi:hypothetical protein
MRKFGLSLGTFIVGLLLSTIAHADYNVFNSTAVETNVTNSRLWIGRGTLRSVIVASTGTTSTLTLYDGVSSSSNLRKISTIDTTALRDLPFDVAVSSGLTITTAGGTPAKLSIIFKAGQ